MAIQRAVVKGSMANLVQTRSMFTCEVIESGGDTYALLWDAYLQSFYDSIEPLMSTFTTTATAELQEWTAPSWVTFDELAFVNAGSDVLQAVANAVSIVLLGKSAGLRHVGRKFISGLTENVVEVNTIAGGLLATAALGLLAYITPFTGIGGGTITPGILDKLGTFRPFVGGTVSSFLGSMRRRKPGIGI